MKDLADMMQPKSAAVVVPSNTTLLIDNNSCLYVGVGGDLTVDMAGVGTDIVFKNVPSGAFLPGEFKRVKTATTATNILVLY